MFHERRQRAIGLAKAQNWAGIVLVPGPNLRYFTGLNLHLSERVILVFFPVAGEVFAVCPAFEAERLQGSIAKTFPWDETTGPEWAIREAFAAYGGGFGILGVEYRTMRLLERELLATSMSGTLNYADVGPITAELRMIKDPSELDLLRRAARLCDQAMEAAHLMIRPGVTENEVAAYVSAKLDKLGHRGFREIMVASGERSAVPHAGATDKELAWGELCWVDIVITEQGYVGDITRTFGVGAVSGRAREMFAAVLAAQEQACRSIKPGITGREVDAVARNCITTAGYGAEFLHRTGHGIGLEVHEEPYLVGTNHKPLAPGNVATVEPGIYVKNLGGVRIEDDVVVTADGIEILTKYPRNVLS